MKHLKILFTLMGLVVTFGLMAPTIANDGREHFIPTLDIELRKEIQKRLKQAGYFKGPVNGRIGPQTRAALENYCRVKGIGNVDYLSPELIKSLLGIDFGPGANQISREQQIELLRLIRRGRTNLPVDPNS